MVYGQAWLVEALFSAMRPLLRRAMIFIAAWPAQGFACTLCHSPQAVSVRARLLQPDLWFNLCAILLPLALLAWTVGMVAVGPANRRRAR